MAKGSSLWSHRDFLNVWKAETVSVFGSQFYLLAMPLAAVIVLDASASQMGLLFAFEMLPFLLFGLLAGVLADRRERRSIMIVCDFGRAIALAAIPVSWYLDVISWPIMYGVAFIAGVFTAFFDISYQAYLPVLVEKSELLDANSKLETSRASSQVAGPSIAGLMVDTIGAPLAMVTNSISFIGSAVFLLRVKKKEVVQRTRACKSVLSEIREGIEIVFSSKILRGIAGCTATGNLFFGMSFALMMLFMESMLELSAGWIGVIFAVGAFGAVAGAIVSGRVVSFLGLGRTIVLSALVGAIPTMLMVLAYPHNALLVLMPIMFTGGAMSVLYNVNQVSLRQAIIPTDLQGKMNATMRFLVWGVYPIGGLIGGILGEALGIRTTILISGLGSVAAVVWVAFSPVWSMRAIPQRVRRVKLSSSRMCRETAPKPVSSQVAD